jgi:hypothetical protein
VIAYVRLLIKNKNLKMEGPENMVKAIGILQNCGQKKLSDKIAGLDN